MQYITHEFLPGHTYVVTAIANESGNKKMVIDINGPDFIMPTSAKAMIYDETLLNSELIPDIADSNASLLEGVWVDTSKKDVQLIFHRDQYILRNGKFGNRGYFVYKDNTIYYGNNSRYLKGEWVIDKMQVDIITNFPIGMSSYNGGNILKYGRFTLQKNE